MDHKYSYQIGFLNPESNLEDETEFDADSYPEALSLFADFWSEQSWGMERLNVCYVHQVLFEE